MLIIKSCFENNQLTNEFNLIQFKRSIEIIERLGLEGWYLYKLASVPNDITTISNVRLVKIQVCRYNGGRLIRTIFVDRDGQSSEFNNLN